MMKVPAALLLLPAVSSAMRVKAGTQTWTEVQKRIDQHGNSAMSTEQPQDFDTTCVPAEDGWKACPYLVQTDLEGIINMTRWEDWEATMWLGGSKTLACDPDALWKADRSLYKHNQLMRAGTAYGGGQITGMLKEYQDGLVDTIAESLENITAFDGLKSAVVQTVNDTQSGITAVFTPKTVLAREPSTEGPNICDSRWAQVTLWDGLTYTINNWKNTPIARVHYAGSGCQEVWTVECQSQKLVKTTYCPFADTTVEFYCLANGFDASCLFRFRGILPPTISGDGTMLVRKPGSDTWAQVEPGLIEVRVVRPSFRGSADVDGTTFGGSIGPIEGFPSTILTLTIPEFTTTLAKNRCQNVTAVAQPGCEAPYASALRLVDYTSAGFHIETLDSDLIIGYPLDLKAVGDQGSESAAGYIGDYIPGFSARDVIVTLSAEGSIINMNIQLFLNGTIYA